MAYTSPSCNCDCQSDYAHVLSTVDSIEEKVDSINGDLEDYVQTHELEEAETEMNGRHAGSAAVWFYGTWRSCSRMQGGNR